MVARGMSRDTFRGLTIIQPEHRVCRSANLESPRFLEILAFEEQLTACHLIQMVRRPNRRAADMRGDTQVRFKHVAVGRNIHQTAPCTFNCLETFGVSPLDALTVRDAMTFSATISAVTADNVQPRYPCPV